MKYSGILIIILLFCFYPSVGQDLTEMPDKGGDLYFNFRNMSFVKNNEYSNSITEGYTLIGYFLHPELIYHPDEKVSLRIGAHLLRYSGTNGFSAVRPAFSTTWHFSDATSFTIGSLSGSDEHRMLDPHFSSERNYCDYQEDGLQFRSISEYLFTDTWLSWENYIFKGDNEREIFTAGESFRYTSPAFSENFRFEIPVQIQFRHYGGQISNYPEPVETYLNIGAGAKISFDLAGNENVSTGFEGMVFTGHSLTNNAPSGIKNGYAVWYKLFYSFRGAEFDAGLWTSHDYYAPNGNPIFSSVSDRYDNVILSGRKLITCSASLKLTHKDFLEFYFAFDGYYDPDLKRFDNAMTLHLRFDRLFKLASLKQG